MTQGIVLAMRNFLPILIFVLSAATFNFVCCFCFNVSSCEMDVAGTKYPVTCVKAAAVGEKLFPFKHDLVKRNRAFHFKQSVNGTGLLPSCFLQDVGAYHVLPSTMLRLSQETKASRLWLLRNKLLL